MNAREKAIRAERIIAAVRAKGNEPVGTGLRDAAHEAFHAMVAGSKSWEREIVHRDLVKKIRRPLDMWVHEMQARAIEQGVCKALDVDCGDLSGWVFTSIMEAIKTGMPHAEPSGSEKIAAGYAESAECAEWVGKILALGDGPRLRMRKVQS